MAKKKAVKPQRGVATTSVASKKQVEDAKAVKQAEATAQAEQEAAAAAPPAEEAPSLEAPPTSGDTHDWEADNYVEEQSLQALVERLNDKGEKEVTRVVKSIEYDRRLASTYPSIVIPESTRETILQEMLKESSDTATTVQQPLSEDQALLRVYVAYKVLLRLGFTVGRIEECLTRGIKETETWEAAIEWMWLHLTEEECLAKGDFAAPAGNNWACDPPLLPPSLPSPPPKPVTVIPEPSSDQTPPPERSPLFRKTLSDDSGSDSDSDGELNMDKANQTWAKLMLELDTLRSGPDNKKGKKKKGPAVVLETPEIRRIKNDLAKVEKEYMFSRKEADAIFKSLQAQARAQALESRLKGISVTDSAEPEETPDVVQASIGSDSEDDLFGNMLEEPDPDAAPTQQPEDPDSTIQVRSMPVPKSFAFSGNIPKAMLKAALGKTSKPASVSYIKLSGYSRATRVGLEISWTSERRRVWKMDEIACDDLVEAENYVATLALSELSARGEIGGVNWRAMPPEYRELWEELETQRGGEVKVEKRQFWAKIRDISNRQISTPTQSAPLDKSGKSASTAETSTAPSGIETPVSERLQADFARRQSASSYQAMLPQRQSLPIASFRQQIIETLENSQIVVLSGETGCGKSTQLPAYILEDQLSKGKACKIYVTEPRRISAISLAQRVSQELGERKGAVGSADSLVGYSIRMEAKVSSNTRLAFVTNGIALRMLESGSAGRGTAFDQVTHIIVDEVHERSIDSDFLLIVLKQLVQQRPDLKVVLMSATLDAEKISAFFGGCPTLSVPGRTFPVTVNHLEDAVELTGYHIDETSPYAVRSRFAKTGAKQLEWNDDAADSDGSDSEGDQDPTKLSATRYSASTVSTVNLLDSRQIPYDLIVRLLEAVCIERPEYRPFSTAILVFMPGLAEIRKLNELLQSHGHFGSADYVIFPLHSTISSEGQGAVFEIPPRGIRKIVISTNIAETGVTIPDVTCVIDTGKHREMRYDERRQISRLVETYIAQDNAKQRRGRAGRVQEGLAFHLFTKVRHDTQMARHAIPEMLRLSLQDLALRIKVLKVKLGSSIEDVLSRALDPPSSINIQRAIASLVEVKALTTNEEITAMGRILSKLPMDVHLGKFIIVAAIFRCLDPALTIAATLNAKSPFITPFGFEAQADSAKKGLATGNSDFLTIANVFASWRRASENPNYVRVYCKKNYLSHQNLQQIEELRQQLLSYLVDSSLIHVTPAQRQEISQARYSRGNRTRFVSVPAEYDVNSENITILNAALAAGMYPKILTLNASGLQTITNQQPVSMAQHPSSINFRTSKADYGSNYLVYFTIMQSKKLYAWETGPVDDRALALFCGDNPDFKISSTALHLDRNIKYHVHPRTAIALKALRQRMTNIMTATMRGKPMDETSAKWFQLAVKCLGSLTDEVVAPIGLLA